MEGVHPTIFQIDFQMMMAEIQKLPLLSIDSVEAFFLDNQQLLDGTAETVSVQERLDFLRKIEDSTVPIVFTDRQQRKHLVFDTKITLQRPMNRQDLKEEPRVSMVFIDADEGLWIQERLTISFAIALTTALTSQTTFVWSPNATNTFNWSYGQWM